MSVVILDMDSELDSSVDMGDLLSETLDEDPDDDDDLILEVHSDSDVEESDDSSQVLRPSRNCYKCGHSHHYRHFIPKKLLSYFPELKVNETESFLELLHLCVQLEKIVQVLNGAANKRMGTYSTKYTKQKFHEKLLLVKATSKCKTKESLMRILPPFLPDLIVDRILHFMIKSDAGNPNIYTFEKHDEPAKTMLHKMYWKLADIYDKMKGLEEANFMCEDCEEIISIILKFTLEDFSDWELSEPFFEEEGRDTSSESKQGSCSKRCDALHNEVFNCDEEVDAIIIE